MTAVGTLRIAAGANLTGKKILLVDDDEALCKSLAEQLQLHEEFAIVIDGTAAEALERVKKNSEQFL